MQNRKAVVAGMPEQVNPECYVCNKPIRDDENGFRYKKGWVHGDGCIDKVGLVDFKELYN